MYLKKQKKFVHFKLKNGLDQTIPPPTTTTHNHPPPFKIYSPPTTTHHHSKYINHHPPSPKTYPALPTISQKMDQHLAKAKICLYVTSYRHCFNSFFFFEMQYSLP